MMPQKIATTSDFIYREVLSSQIVYKIQLRVINKDIHLVILYHTICDTCRLVSSRHHGGQLYGNYVRVHKQILLHWVQQLFLSFGLLNQSFPCLSFYSHLTFISEFNSSQILSDIFHPLQPRSTNSPYCNSSPHCYSFHRPFLSSVLNMPKLLYSLCFLHLSVVTF